MNSIINNKTIKIIIIFIFIVIIGVLSKIIVDTIVTKNEIKSAKKAVTIKDDVHMYSSAKKGKKYDSIEIGKDVYILKSFVDDNDDKWCKVKVGKKIGYVLSKNVGMYDDSYDEKNLMLDVSKFNMEKNFKSIGEFKSFIINNNIKFVYIRAGGRGYGKAGNMYTDAFADDYAEACEYLGVPFGYYFLDEAINSNEVDEEVAFINQYVQNHKYKKNVLPIALDVEKHSEPGRADQIWDERYKLVNEIIKKIEMNGNKAIMYSNAKLTDEYLCQVDAKMWLAYYPQISEIPEYWYTDTTEKGATNETIKEKMIGWQFTENGVGNIINCKVDLSIVYSKYLLGEE